MRASDDLLAEHDVRAVFGACEPHLVPMYLDYERPYGSANISNPDAGYLIPMVAFMQGPEAFAEFGTDGRLPRSVEDVVTGSGTIACAPLQGASEYVGAVTRDLSQLGTTLFDGLTENEMKACIERSIVIRCAAGDRLLKQGGTGRNIFLVLDGRLDVSDGGAVVGDVRPGEVVGEMAYLLGQPRRFDVDVVEPDTRVLSLSERTLRWLEQTNPGVAMKLLANISKQLCRRLTTRTDVTQVTGVRP
jgi:hypothetical protein